MEGPRGFVDPARPLEGSHPLNRGLLSEWSVVPNAGWRGGLTARDLARGARPPTDGTLNGGTAWAGAKGRPGGCGTWSGDGTDDYVSFPTAKFTSAITNQLTVTFWAYPTSSGGSDRWFFTLGGSNFAVRYAFTSLSNTTLVFYNASFTQIETGWTVAPVVNVWNHFGVNFDGATVRLWLNGKPAGSVAKTTAWEWGFVNATSAFLAKYDGTTPLAGYMDEVRVSNACLSVPAVYAESRRGNPERWRWVGRRTWFAPSDAGPAAYTLAAAAGSFAETGNAAGLLAGRRLTASAGTFAEAGNAAGLAVGRKVTAVAGSFAESGNAAGLLVGRRLTAAAGAFAETGNAAGLKVGRLLACSPGSYAVTGNAAGLVYAPAGHFILSAGAGNVTLTGRAASPLVGRRLASAAGAFALTGNAAALTYSGVVPAPPTARTFDLPVTRLLTFDLPVARSLSFDEGI